jgi:hypothetical protein
MASTSESTQLSNIEMEAAIEQFSTFTGANESTARMALEACNWNIELAVNMFVDANDGPIDVIDNSNDLRHVSNTSSLTQTNSLSSQTNDDIRPPIPPVRQVLVEDYPSVSYSNHLRRPNSNSVFDAFRDFEQEARWHEQQMVRESNGSSSATATKRRTLEDLFRPPLDLICRGTLEIAKDEGQRHNKWLMVNIQNHQEFSCQVLNRDVWSNPAVKSIISEHFIFWQTYHDNNEGQRFMQFYNVTDFPYVAILDPRTGEKMRQWTTIDPVTFCDLVTEFLHSHPSPSGSSQSLDDLNFMRKSTVEKQTLYDESEEMQLKAAIAASLKEVAKNEQNTTNQFNNDVDDSDLETFESDNEENTKNNSNDAQFKTNFKSESIKNAKESGVSSTSLSNCNSQEAKLNTAEDWRQYLGPENGNKFEFVVRYPDGNRENITFPSESQLKALFLYLSAKGYNMNDYDLITNFPKKNLKEISNSDTITLESAGIHSRDTLYVQHKT